MHMIRMTKDGFVAKGTASDFPRFADLEYHMKPLPKRRRRAPMTRDRFWVLASQNVGMGLCLGFVIAGFVANTARLIQNLAIIATGFGQ